MQLDRALQQVDDLANIMAGHQDSSQQFPTGLKVLLCCDSLQDSEDNRNSADTAALLSDLQYQVTQASDAQQAASLLNSSKSSFDLVLADASAAVGHSLFEAAAGRGTPLVLIAPHDFAAADVMAAVQAGAADVLERPLSRSKVQHLWQHAVRASLSHSRPPQQQQHARAGQPQAPTPRAAAAATTAAAAAAKLASPMCFGLLDQQDCMIDGLDVLGGLELPPQLDFKPLDSILSDMHATHATSRAPADSLTAFPAGSPSHNSNAATAMVASLFGCSSEQQQGSGDTSMAAAAAEELESCADASSAGPLQSRRRKLRACTSLRSMAAASGACECGTDQWAAAAPAPAAAGGINQPFMGCPAMPPGAMGMGYGSSAMQGAAAWGSMPGPQGCMGMGMGTQHMPPMAEQLPRGMVWGLPVHNVAVAPGIVPTGNSNSSSSHAGPAAAAPSSSGCGGSSGVNAALRAHAAPAPAQPVAPAVAPQQMCPLPMPMPPGMWSPPGMWGPMMYPMWHPMMHPGMMAGQAWPAAAAAAPNPAAAAGGSMLSAQPPSQLQQQGGLGSMAAGWAATPFAAPGVQQQ